MTKLRWVGALFITIIVMGCAPTAPTRDELTIGFRYSRFDPGSVSVRAGVPITFTLRNDDPIGHEWIIGGPEVHAAHRTGTEAFHEGRPNEVTAPAFATRTTTITFERPGAYDFICHLPGHEAYGMKGTLRVV